MTTFWKESSKAWEQIFVIEDMPAWNPNLRSKTAIRTSFTRYFVDPSIAVAALGVGPKDLVNDLNTFGLLFETMCVRDLRVYADASVEQYITIETRTVWNVMLSYIGAYTYQREDGVWVVSISSLKN